MDVVTTVEGLRRRLDEYRLVGGQGSIGLVPTMGALHEGHLSLIRLARAYDAIVVVSIFVNPAQFTDYADLERYPRMPERDLALLEAGGADLVFMPSVGEVYPPGFATHVEVRRLGTVLEGASRPGHFDGVATVVTKLLNIVGPRHAYFGQKDGQQVVVVRCLVRDLNLPVEIVVGPTLREADGLAMSSRNVRLSPPERMAAAVLYQALCTARDCYLSGEHDADVLRALMRDIVSREPIMRLDYAEVADGTTLVPATLAMPGALLLIAAYAGPVRLIDNLVLHDASWL